MRLTANDNPRLYFSVAIPLILVLGWYVAGSGVSPSCGPTLSRGVPFLKHHQAQKLLLVQVKPVYPPLARINYIHGRVQLLLSINSQGKVEKAHVVEGHPFLAVAALKAIRRWVYRPFETRTGPAKFQTLVEVKFDLLTADITKEKLPPQPEKFLARAIRPPKVISQSGIRKADASVRLRLLISKKGRVMDATLVAGPQKQLRAACRTIAHWKFQPARWGNFDVPWYINVTVPVRTDLSPPNSSK